MSIEIPKKQNTCAVIVTYNPDSDLPDRVSRILPQVDSLLIVDNCSNDAEQSMLRHLALTPNIYLITNDDNYGIARGLNQGICWAMERKYLWALTFDQDSTAYEFILDKLAEVCGDAMNQGKIAVIGSSGWDSVRKQMHPPESEFGGRKWIECRVVITSGSLISVSAFDSIGPHREDFFIDSVDEEYCLRARREGYLVLCAFGPLMDHSIGAITRHKLFSPKYATNHSALRRYYATRNSVVLAWEYRKVDPYWLKSTIHHVLKNFALVVFFEDCKIAKLRMMFSGLADAVRGRMGQLRQS